MLFLLVLVLFSFFLHKLCAAKGISPWNYLIGFATGFFVLLFATSAAMIIVYGQNVLNEPDFDKKLILFAPFTIVSQFLLFLFLRMKISRARVSKDDDDEPKLPTDKGKKDLSYFR